MTGFPMARMRDEFGPLFERLFRAWPFEPVVEPERWNLEVIENEKELVVRAEVPGFETPELEVELRNNRLYIKAERKRKVEEKEKSAEYTERRFERYLELPVEVNPEKIEATYRNGVLEVHLPRKEEAPGRRIEVK